MPFDLETKIYTLFPLPKAADGHNISLCLDLSNEPLARLQIDDMDGRNVSYQLINRTLFLEYISNVMPEFDPSFHIPLQYDFRLFHIFTYYNHFADYIAIDLRSGKAYRCICWVWGKGTSYESLYIPISFREIRDLAPASSQYKKIDESNYKTFLPPSGTMW